MVVREVSRRTNLVDSRVVEVVGEFILAITTVNVVDTTLDMFDVYYGEEKK